MKNEVSLTLVKEIYRALDAKKAESLRALDVRVLSSITDYIIVATGTADTHLRALRVETEKVLDAAGVRILGVEGERESGWVVVDAFEIMVHLFREDTRSRYRLEQLWGDALELDRDELLAEKKPSAPLPKKKATPKKESVAATAQTKRSSRLSS